MNDDDLIRLFVELTGASEEQARSVIIHLDLYNLTPESDATARKFAGLFRENFKTYEAGASSEVKAAGPA